MSVTDEVKSRIDIVDLVSESGVKLRKSGRNHTGFCPFHANKHTPAFVVWPETGTWRCFGECNEGGDVFKFVMKKEGIDFREALTRLAKRAGVELPEYSRQTPEQKEAFEHLRHLLEDALTFYRGHLQGNASLMTYLQEKRGLTPSSIEAFGLGYAPNRWDATLTHFTQRGYSFQDMVDAGLLGEREDGSRFDRFRNRLMIPIRDETGRMAGFGARVVDPDDMPKFLNSPDTPVFSKGRLLYGLDRARQSIRKADQVVIVEGYLDVMALHQAGFENVVSPMGTALTEDQLRLLKRSTRRIVLALDSDSAGQKAVLRGLEAARKAMDREGELGFDALGLLRSEARLQADLRVASLPEGMDPDDLVRSDPEAWKQLIEQAKPIVSHVMQSLAAGENLRDAKVKNRLAAQVLPIIEDLPNAAERDTYRQELARLLGVYEGSLAPTATGRLRVRRARADSVTHADSHPEPETGARLAILVGHQAEGYILSTLVNQPELLYRLDRMLQQFGLESLASSDFGSTDHQLAIAVVRQSLEQDETDPPQFVRENLPEAVQGLAHAASPGPEPSGRAADRLLEELLRLVIKMRRVAMNENLSQLRWLQEEAQQDGDLRAASYADQVLQHTRLLRDLDQANRRIALRRLE
jgi:DNA primase